MAFRGRRLALLCSLCPLPTRGRHVALLCSLCFLSWPLRELLWPPHGVANPVLAPAWLSVAPAWPYLLSLLPCVAVAPCGSCLLCFRLWLLDFCGTFVLAPAWPSSVPVWPYFAFLCFLFLLRPSVAFAWPLLSLAWAPHGMFGPAWPYLAYLASCLGPVMAFCGLLVAFLNFLSWPLRGPPRPQRGHYLLCCFPHLRHPWVDPLAHGVACVLAASSFRPA